MSRPLPRPRPAGRGLAWIFEIVFVLGLTAAFLVGIVHAALTVYFANVGLNPGIRFLGYEIGGQSEDAAKDRIQKIIETTFRDPVLLEKDNTVFFLHHGDQFRLKVDLDALMAMARSADKGKDIWVRAEEALEADYRPIDLPWEPTLDRELSEEALAHLLEESGDGTRTQAYLLPDRAGVPGAPGGRLRVVTTAAREQHLAILDQLEALCRRAPLRHPRVLQAQIPALKGTELTTDAATAFAHVVGSARIRYDAVDFARASNMALALGRLEGRILNPGDRLDFSVAAGPVTSESGYVQAIAGTSLAPAPLWGAGAEVVACALFQAMAKAGAKVLARTHHPFYWKELAGYVGLGFDVRLRDGGNMVLENTWPFPLRLRVAQTAQEVAVDVLSLQALPATVELRVGVPEKVPYKTELVQDPSLPRQVEVVEQEGLDGYRVKIFRKLVRSDGRASREELLGDQVIDYAALPSRIRVGIGDPNRPPPGWNEGLPPLPPSPRPNPGFEPDFELGP